MHGPDEDDVVEQGGRPLLPEWARLPRWLPGLGGRLSRGAALFGLATLIVGLAAGYALLGERHSGQPSRPAARRCRRLPPPAMTTCSAWPRRENGRTGTTRLPRFLSRTGREGSGAPNAGFATP